MMNLLNVLDRMVSCTRKKKEENSCLKKKKSSLYLSFFSVASKLFADWFSFFLYFSGSGAFFGFFSFYFFDTT